MKIYLIRHGESTSDVKERYDGDYDDHLTERGRVEAELIAKKLLKMGVEIVYSSARIRARETSEIVCSILGCETAVMEELNEQNIYNAYQALAIEQPEEEYRKLGELIARREQNYPGVETYAQLKERVIRGLSKILADTHQTVAVITHGGPIRCIVREVLRLGELRSLENGTIIELEKDGENLRLMNVSGAVFERGATE